ncbi:MAG: Mur ligase domain-containing protein, partial [Planctomycetes bacterium]|nr:Mur ligase domain-containing protein [Planctomycetota bacterium]
MDPLTLDAAARAVGADPLPVEFQSLAATGASIDTRTLEPGDLFFALPGERADGHRFLARAREAGAAAAV